MPHEVVLLHGWCCNTKFWREQAPLREHFRVFEAEYSPSATTLDEFAQSAMAGIEASLLVDPVLVGHSMGVTVARRIAELQPGRVRALISIDGAITRNRTEQARARTDAVCAELETAGFGPLSRAFLDAMFADETPVPLRRWITNEMTSADPVWAAKVLRDVVYSDYWDRVAAFDGPVLALNRTARNSRRRLDHDAVLPLLDYREIEGSGHFVMLERPAEINEAIQDFIDSLP